MQRTNASGPAGDAASGSDLRQSAFRIVGAQFVVSIFLALALLAWRGLDAASSALAGGVICVVANAGFAARVFRDGSGDDPRKALSAFYVGEVLKIALTAGLFAVAIVATDLGILMMMLGYVAATGVFWFALIVGDRVNERREQS